MFGTVLGTGWDGVSDLLYFQRLQPASKNLVSSIPTVSTIKGYICSAVAFF
jgi:hypothetical protein